MEKGVIQADLPTKAGQSGTCAAVAGDFVGWFRQKMACP